MFVELARNYKRYQRNGGSETAATSKMELVVTVLING